MPPEIISLIESFPWEFELIGNETAEEKAQLIAMLKASKRFAAEIILGREPRWLTLCGKSGCGKTFLAERVRKFLALHARDAYEKMRKLKDETDESLLFSYAQTGSFFVKWSTLVETSRDRNYAPFRQACSDWVKIVDDIGAAGYANTTDADGNIKLTPFVLEKLGKLADDRLRKWTMLTCNYSLSQIGDQMDARIASRMLRHGSVVLETSARDFNIRRREMELKP